MGNRPASDLGSLSDQPYVPCLKWKQGEYQALLRLDAATKARIIPLIEVPEIGWDFETRSEAKTLDEHLAPFAKRVQAKWEDRACLVDLGLLDPSARIADGTHPVSFLFDQLRAHRCVCIPVTALKRDVPYQEAVRAVVSRDKSGVCLRIPLPDAAKPEVGRALDVLLRSLGTSPDETDFVLDLGAPNFRPLDGFSKVVLRILRGLPRSSEWRTLTLIGTAFPQTLAGLSTGLHRADRSEWLLYKRLLSGLQREDCRLPAFGDYGIAHPDVLAIDMRKAKPAASIRYAAEDAWYILKGPNVRQHGFEQYRRLCGTLVSSGVFAGRAFSEGDAYIEDCACGRGSTGSLTTWRWVGTNHHITRVVVDLASLLGSSDTT